TVSLRDALPIFAEKTTAHRFEERPLNGGRTSRAGRAENLFFHHYLLPLTPGRLDRFCLRANPRLDLWKDLDEPGRRVGSLRTSKRMAPASGATSNRRTFTLSPS